METYLYGISQIAQNLCYLTFWVQGYLVWAGLISKCRNDSKFMSFWEDKGFWLILVVNEYTRVEIHDFGYLQI